MPKPVRIVRSEDNYFRDTLRKTIEKSAEAEEKRAAVRRAVLESVVEYISSVKREEEEVRQRHPGITRMPRHIDMLDAIMRADAHKLERESDVVWLCDKLVSGGHKHPFENFEREYSPVRKGEWAEFIEAFWIGSWASKRDMSAWGFAVTIWKHKDRWLTRPNRPFVEEDVSPSVPPAKLPDSKHRVFTQKPPHELLALYKGRTALQADVLIEPHKGLWIETEGRIQFLGPDNKGSVAALRTETNDGIECRFGAAWNKTLTTCEKESVIKVCGKIAPHQNGSQLYLLECEMILVTNEKKNDLITDKTPHDLLDLFKSRTALQAMEMIEPYVGRKIETEGQVMNLYANNNGVAAFLRTHLNGDIISCPFNHKWREKLKDVQIGFCMKVRGTVAGNQNGQQLYLLDCEII